MSTSVPSAVPAPWLAFVAVLDSATAAWRGGVFSFFVLLHCLDDAVRAGPSVCSSASAVLERVPANRQNEKARSTAGKCRPSKNYSLRRPTLSRVQHPGQKTVADGRWTDGIKAEPCVSCATPDSTRLPNPELAQPHERLGKSGRKVNSRNSCPSGSRVVALSLSLLVCSASRRLPSCAHHWCQMSALCASAAVMRLLFCANKSTTGYAESVSLAARVLFTSTRVQANGQVSGIVTYAAHRLKRDGDIYKVLTLPQSSVMFAKHDMFQV